MNLPNRLTMLRLILSVLFIIMLVQPGLYYKVDALILFVLASITDFLDGYYARKFNLITDFGKLMDPIADKILTLCAFFIFSLFNIIPLWMFLIIFIREVTVTFFRIIAVKKAKVQAAEKMGKVKTVFQIISIILVLLYLIIIEIPSLSSMIILSWMIWSITAVMYIVVLLTIISGASYFRNNLL